MGVLSALNPTALDGSCLWYVSFVQGNEMQPYSCILLELSRGHASQGAAEDATAAVMLAPTSPCALTTRALVYASVGDIQVRAETNALRRGKSQLD